MFQSALTTNSDWQIALETCVKQVSSGIPANLGFIYVTEPFSSHLTEILHALRASTNIDNWVGSVGMGICAISESQSGEYFEEPAIAIMTAKLPDQSFNLFSSSDTLENKNILFDPEGKQFPEGLPFILSHADSANPETLKMIQELNETHENFMVGGLTASPNQHHHVSGSVTGGGLSGIIFSPELEIITTLSQGCQPLGEIHRIGSCDGNLIMDLDHSRASDVLFKDVNVRTMSDFQKVAGNIHAGLPVAGSDTGDYLVRNLIGLDENNGIVAIGAPVNEGDLIMFVRRDPEAARLDLQNTLSNLSKRAKNKIKGGIYISCIARGPNMFGTQNAEVNLIREIIGDIPLVGMFANGEISANRLYTYTGVLSLFL